MSIHAATCMCERKKKRGGQDWQSLSMHQVKSQPVMNPGLYIFRGDHKTKQSSVQMFPFLIRQRPAHGTNHFTAIDGVIVRGRFVVFSLNYGDNHFRAAAATRVKRCLDAFRGALGTDRGPGGLAVTSRLCNTPFLSRHGRQLGWGHCLITCPRPCSHSQLAPCSPGWPVVSLGK